MDTHQTRASRTLQQHGLTVASSMSGLEVWIPQTVLLPEIATNALALSVVLFCACVFLAGLGIYSPVLIQISTIGLAVSVPVFLLFGVLHVALSNVHALRRHTDQLVVLSPRSLTTRKKTIPYESIHYIDQHRFVFLTHWLYACTRDGQRIHIAAHDGEAAMRELMDLIKQHQRQHERLLEQEGHDPEEIVRPPASLGLLRKT